MKTLAVLITAIPAIAFAQTKSMDPDAEILVACLYQKAVDLDDGRSDAATIAIGIATECRRYQQHMLDKVFKQLGTAPYRQDSPLGLADFQMLQQQAIVLVLRQRASKTH